MYYKIGWKLLVEYKWLYGKPFTIIRSMDTIESRTISSELFDLFFIFHLEAFGSNLQRKRVVHTKYRRTRNSLVRYPTRNAYRQMLIAGYSQRENIFERNSQFRSISFGNKQFHWFIFDRVQIIVHLMHLQCPHLTRFSSYTCVRNYCTNRLTSYN